MVGEKELGQPEDECACAIKFVGASRPVIRDQAREHGQSEQQDEENNQPGRRMSCAIGWRRNRRSSCIRLQPPPAHQPTASDDRDLTPRGGQQEQYPRGGYGHD